MKFIVSHPTGNNFVHALIEGLHNKNFLSKFYTTIGFGKSCSVLYSKIKNKREYNIPDEKIKRLWFPEIYRLLTNSDQEKKRMLTDRSYKALDSKTASEISILSARIIHAYEDGAFSTFIKAKEFGIQCSYELPIAHWATVRRLLAEEPRYLIGTHLESTRTGRKTLSKRKRIKACGSNHLPSVCIGFHRQIRQKTPAKSAFGSPPVTVDFDAPKQIIISSYYLRDHEPTQRACGSF